MRWRLVRLCRLPTSSTAERGGIAAVEQPAEIGGGGAESRQLPGGKKPLVLRSEAPVCLMPPH